MTNKFKFFKKKLAFLLFGIFLCVAVFGQSVTKEFIRTPLSNVLKEIERQTGLSFVYDRKDLSDAKLITQTFKDTPVEKVLSAILDENMDFSIRNKMVMIHKKEKTPQQRAMKTVSGTVADANGEPIIGASIAIKGDKTGTVTDVDGKFSIQAAAGSILAVSYIGYAPQEIRLGENANLQIVLLEDLRQLGEVVVVGYGTQKKSDITGSVSSVKTSEIQSAPSVNTAQALQGRAAGIMVQNMSGYPAGDVVIRIRGANSLTYGNDPLIIIDGVQGATLENLNPNDIQSAEILKDAAALSVYGSRGANGVILITTKNGKKGSPQFAYNFFTSFDKVRRTLPTMTASQYATLHNESNRELNKPLMFDNPESLGKGTDWQDAIFRTGFSHNHNLSVNGTKEGISYFIAGGIVEKDGIILASDYKQYTLRANLKVEATKRLSFALNTFTSYDVTKNGDVSAGIISALQWSPTKAVYDNTVPGGYTQPGGGIGPVELYNPVGYMKEINSDHFKSAFNVAPSVEYKLTDYLKISSLLAYQQSNTVKGWFDNQVANNGPASNVSGSLTNGVYLSLQNTNILTFDKTFGDHNVKITGVYEILSDQYRGNSTSAKGIPVGLGYNGIKFGTTFQQPWVSLVNTAMRSFMGRINYGYKNRYMFSFSDRYDGASQLAEGHKFDNFTAVSAGWNIMNETFFESLQKAVPELKIRASYGTVGNAAVPAYASLLMFTSGLDADNNPTLTLSQLGNENLKWERTTESNIGIDARIFQGRISLSAEYYSKKTTDLLMWQNVPIALGVPSVLTNVGEVTNKGFDFSIGGTPVSSGQLSWNTNFVFNYNKNRINKLDGMSNTLIYSDADYPGLTGSFVQMVGQPMGTFLGYTYAGVWTTDEASTAALYGSKPGDAKYADINRDGKIDKDDIGIIGNANPKHTFGWNNTISYGNFDLNMFWQGVAGNDIYNQNRIRRESNASSAFPTSPVITEHWTPERQNTSVPAISGFEYVNSSRWVEDGSYLRLKNVTLSWRFPKKLLENTRVLSSARIYASGANLLTMTKYTGFDPEASIGKDAVAAGVDRSVYPSSKSFIIGLDLSF